MSAKDGARGRPGEESRAASRHTPTKGAAGALAGRAHGFRTRSIHAGQAPDPATGAIITPIYQTSTYVQEDVGKHKGYEYSRTGNPTRRALEDNVASLEGGDAASAFASGMAAISTLVQLYDTGRKIVVSQNVYGGTFRLFDKVCRRQGYEFAYVDSRDLGAIERALTPGTALLFLESPTNPLMHITDIRAAVALAHRVGAKVAVDNTFLTPYFQRPIELGADFVVHSATKYLGGHSDVLGGLLVTTTKDDTVAVRAIQNSVGAILGPFDAWLILRGIKTLALRMEAHESNARAVASFLSTHPRVACVYYPALPDHPGHEVHFRQATGAGGLLSFELADGHSPSKLMRACRVLSLAESLGAVESLISIPSVMTHASVPPAERARLGIKDSLLRIAVGVEDQADILADLENALAAS